MSTEIAGLYTTLTAADEQFVAACQRDATAMEEVATASEAANAKVKAGAGERVAAEEAAAGSTVASQGRMATGWAGLTKAVEEHGTKAEQVWNKVTHIGQMSGLALLAIGAVSVHMASDFQSSMELIHSQAGASQDEVAKLSQQVLDLAPTVGAGPDKLAEGLYHIESAGFRGSQAMDILTASAKDAAIGMSDMESTSQALIGVMAVGFGDVKDAADAAAFLNTTVGIGDMRMEKLAAAISTGVLPSFKSAGLGMTDFSAALATLTDNVTPADEAATRLRMTVALLAAPSHQAFQALESIGLGAEEANGALANRDSLQQYGISISQLSEDLHQPNGLLVAVMDLKHHLEDAGLTATEQTAVIEHAFGGGRTSGAILTLLEESDRLASKYDAIGDSASRAAGLQDSWSATQDTFKQQLHDVGAQIQVIGIQIGTWLLPPLTKAFGWLADHPGAMKLFFGVVVAGMVAFTAAVIANTIAWLANPVTWIVLAFVVAIGIMVVSIYYMVTHFKLAWEGLKGVALLVWHWLVDAWHWTLGKLSEGAAWVKDHVIAPIVHFFDQYLVQPVKTYLRILTAVWEFAWGFLSVIIDDFVQIWLKNWHMITGIAQWAWENILKPTWDFIVKYGIDPIKEGIHLLGVGWSIAWDWICNRASDAWDILKVIWGFINDYGIQPIHSAISWLAGEWDRIWGAISGTVENIYYNYIQPILDKITSGINTVKGDISSVLNAPGRAGQMFAHLLGFDQGGWVPGSPGSPMLAVVHGGEFVVSRDMLAGKQASPIRVGSPAGSVGAGTPSRSVVENHVHVYLDGEEIQRSTMRSAGRHKLRNGNNGF